MFRRTTPSASKEAVSPDRDVMDALRSADETSHVACDHWVIRNVTANSPQKSIAREPERAGTKCHARSTCATAA